MTLTKTQRRALELVRMRLDPKHPRFTASAEVAAALRSIAPYLHTWVLPLVDYSLGSGYHGQVDEIRRDHCVRLG